MNNFRKNLIMLLLKPQETPELIDTIIYDMFAFMPKEQRIQFIEKMVPKYADMALAHLKPEDKKLETQKLQKKFCNKIDDINQVAVKWLNIPDDERVPLNCC